jgi:hypothetical protein
MEIFTSDWKTAFHRLLSFYRLLYLGTILWEFFVTIGIGTSQQSLLLIGTGIALKPAILLVWLICMLGLLVIFLDISFRHVDSTKYSTLAYFLLSGMLCVHLSMIFLALTASAIVWPLVLNFLTSAIWVASLIYFRRQFAIIER